jgi:hypothetical protein
MKINSSKTFMCYAKCKEGRLVIPKRLQYTAIAWYHHYLQHPDYTRLEETLKQAMYWTNMRTSVQQFVRQCKSCQITNALITSMVNYHRNLLSKFPGKRYV